jgi:peptidoglycan/LPS O-acetylase OafA/YrhL
VIFLFWKYYANVQFPKTQDPSLYLYGILDGLQIWAIVLTVAGFARHHLNYRNATLAYLTPAVYPFYILHQTVIVATGYYITQWSLPIAVKLVLLILMCFAMIFGIYHFLIRPFILPRVLFGLKPRQQDNQRKLVFHAVQKPIPE